jgi:indole-3-glycerol phosphate synthase
MSTRRGSRSWCLTPSRLRALIAAALERGLAALTEVHAPEEVSVALDAGADLIGVNARDLHTLVMDAGRAQRVLESLPPSVTKVHLSGIRDETQISAVARTGVDAALVGECLMREDEPSQLLGRLVAAGA